MSESKKDVPEPSMEEILSSIRRIIAEEDETGAPRPAFGADDAKRPAASDPGGDDVLELTDRIDDGMHPSFAAGQRNDAAAQAAPASASASPGSASSEASPIEQSAGGASAPAAQEGSVAESSPLVSNTTAAMSTAAFSKLARAAAPAASEAPLPISGMTVEQLLISLLEPMLKDWFDQHLPAVVERIVEEEVKKLVRRAELQ